MSESITWENPPEYAYFTGGGVRGRYLEFAAALKGNPGQWAVLPGGEKKTENSAKATAQNIAAGKVGGFAPKGSFEAACAGAKIYVRFKGAATPTESQHGEAQQTEAQASEAAAARAWAREHGHPDLSSHGRLPQAILDAYRARDTAE